MLPGFAPLGCSNTPVSELRKDTTTVGGTLTSTNHAIGTARTDREVFVLVSGRNGTSSGRTLTSVTIGGIAANIRAQASTDSSGTQIAAIAAANVPTGTTATIVLGFSGSMEEVDMSVICLGDLLSRTPFDTAATEIATAGTTTEGTIGWALGGYVMAVFSNDNSAASNTWSVLSEVYDLDVGDTRASVAALETSTNDTSATITVTHASSGRRALAIVSMR